MVKLALLSLKQKYEKLNAKRFNDEERSCDIYNRTNLD